MEENDDPATGLRGARILVVEDEFYLADDLAAALRQAGAEVLGPAGTVDEAQSFIADGGFDCAIMDINLRGDMAFPIADRLRDSGIPFLITTGYNSASLPDRFAGVPRVEKPADTRKVIEALPALLAGGAKHS